MCDWKVTWNAKWYNYLNRIQIFKNDNNDNIIYQSKGNANMVIEPNINDIVYISCNKLKIMKCIVISNFINGNEQKNDICNMSNDYDNKLSNENRRHANNNEYLKIKILEVYNNPTKLNGNQRTWTKMKYEMD